MFNVKVSGITTINIYKQPLNLSFIEKTQSGVCGGWLRYLSFRILRRNEKLKARLYVQQQQCVHKSSVEKRHVLVNRKNVCLLHATPMRHAARIRDEQN